MVKVGDTVVPIKEWLTGIRATWSLTGTGMVYGIVRYDFNAQHPDELEAKSGEKVTIIAQSDLKWFVAKPIGRPGEQGLIPVSYVQVKDVATGQTVADPQEAVRRAGVASVDVLKFYGLL
jgi:bud emergence protein 1